MLLTGGRGGRANHQEDDGTTLPTAFGYGGGRVRYNTKPARTFGGGNENGNSYMATGGNVNASPVNQMTLPTSNYFPQLQQPPPPMNFNTPPPFGKFNHPPGSMRGGFGFNHGPAKM
ncbi:hypothetical protein PR048_022305 [Dryococelus australis]|uniref:Uncharacterized protein n=1 Tax=Dryococelus australis TaxID=614101 RepID=A0ABQ9H0M1_9NEOP|nr:hypothetical protein PR048_022305 [Dryococelus australis]